MIEFQDYSFTYNEAEQQALSSINLKIRKGECVLIHGPSGCGKSTLAMTLNGIIPNMIHGSHTGDILLAGESVSGSQTRDLSVRVGMVLQNPDNQLFAITVEEDVAFGPENLGLDDREMHRRVDDALSATGMRHLGSRQIHRLSGGQKQRTAIAGLTAMRPEILVFDEPTADLDPEGTREVISIIDRLHREQHKTVLVIEHKLREILPVVDRIITLNDGRIIQDLPVRHADPATLSLPIPRSSGRREGRGPVHLRVQDLHYHYPDGTRALDGVSLEVYRAECLALMGKNGSGKTTLSKCIAGLVNPSAGTVLFACDTPQKHGRSSAPKIGYLFQNPDHQIVTDRVDREVAVGLSFLPVEQREERVNVALSQVNLLHLNLRDPCTLSRGERQRLAVASVLAMDPEIIIFDEPTTGQDADNLAALAEYFRMMNRQGKTILMITHDTDLASACADRIVVMEAGKITRAFCPDTGISPDET